jgi:hypothetical protein
MKNLTNTSASKKQFVDCIGIIVNVFKIKPPNMFTLK